MLQGDKAPAARPSTCGAAKCLRRSVRPSWGISAKRSIWGAGWWPEWVVRAGGHRGVKYCKSFFCNDLNFVFWGQGTGVWARLGGLGRAFGYMRKRDRHKEKEQKRAEAGLRAADVISKTGGLPPGFFLAGSPEAQRREEELRAEPPAPPEPRWWQCTGPKTPEGKAVSSQNARTHGLTSQKLFLPGENEQEFAEMRETWFVQYPPESVAEGEMVEQLARQHWFLRRAERRYADVEERLGESSAADWSDEQFRLLERIVRYKTTAERSFQRSLTMVRQLRKDRQQEERAAAQAEARQQAATQSRVVYEGRGKNKKPVFRVLEQWVEARVTEGVTTTVYVPTNEEMREKARASEENGVTPQMVYRRMNFPDSVPPEYAWTNRHDPTQCEKTAAGAFCPLCAVDERGGCGIQRMTYETWQAVVEREKEVPGQHAGPTGVGNLPTPKERGGEVPFAEMKEWVAGTDESDEKAAEISGSAPDAECSSVPHLRDGEAAEMITALEDRPEIPKNE